MNTNNTSFILQPYKVSQLATLYGVHRNTFCGWLTPFQHEIGHRNGYYFSITQVRVITEKLGIPGCSIGE
jgi:hypothetical protein